MIDRWIVLVIDCTYGVGCAGNERLWFAFALSCLDSTVAVRMSELVVCHVMQ